MLITKIRITFLHDRVKSNSLHTKKYIFINKYNIIYLNIRGMFTKHHVNMTNKMYLYLYNLQMTCFYS